MTTPRTIGFPRMMKEPAERRVFLPEFIQHLAQQGLTVCVEEGYGSRSGFTFDDYRQGNAAGVPVQPRGGLSPGPGDCPALADP